MPYRVTQRAQQQRDARRKRIVDTAKHLFATQGYAATTMQQVVRAAGTSIGNCYFYFPNKEALVAAIVDDLIHQVSATIDQALATAPAGPTQFAVALYVGTLAFAEHRDLTRVVLIEAEQTELRNAALAHFTARVTHALAAQPALLRGADPMLVAQAWQGAAFNLLEHLLSDEQPRDPQVVGRFLARWNLQALGLAPDVVDQALEQLDRWIAHGEQA